MKKINYKQLRRNKPLLILTIVVALTLWPFILGYFLYTKSKKIANQKLQIAAYITTAVIVFFCSGIYVAALSGGDQSTQQTNEAPANSSSPSNHPSQSSSTQPSEPPTQPIGSRTKTSGCVIAGALQDRACTPGAVFANVTKEQVCTSGYASSVRNVSESTKNAVYAEYGITSHTTGQYEIDHLVSLELGGSNDIANLWPEAANPTPGFHQKDTIENELHSEVCNGTISLSQAQNEIASNWLAIYQGTTPSTSSAPQVMQTQQPAQTTTDTSGIVKLSTTGICHAPGDPSYTRTTNYTPYNTLQDCLNAGGRLPKN